MVVEGVEKASGKKVAIKVMELASRGSREVAYLRQEAQVMQTIATTGGHPNVLRLLHAEEEEGKLFLVLEYCAGGSLRSLLQASPGKRLQERQAAHFLRQLAAGLVFLARYDIVHRDLKTDNLMLDAPNAAATLKIGDFGFSKQLADPDAMLESQLGTPMYSAPEILSNDTQYYTKKSDVWSVGVILYEMTVGTYPWAGAKSVPELLQRQARPVPFPPSQLSHAVRDLVQKMLEPQQDLRLTFHELDRHPFVRGFINVKVAHVLLDPATDVVLGRAPLLPIHDVEVHPESDLDQFQQAVWSCTNIMPDSQFLVDAAQTVVVTESHFRQMLGRDETIPEVLVFDVKLVEQASGSATAASTVDAMAPPAPVDAATSLGESYSTYLRHSAAPDRNARAQLDSTFDAMLALGTACGAAFTRCDALTEALALLRAAPQRLKETARRTFADTERLTSAQRERYTSLRSDAERTLADLRSTQEKLAATRLPDPPGGSLLAAADREFSVSRTAKRLHETSSWLDRVFASIDAHARSGAAWASYQPTVSAYVVKECRDLKTNLRSDVDHVFMLNDVFEQQHRKTKDAAGQSTVSSEELHHLYDIHVDELTSSLQTLQSLLDTEYRMRFAYHEGVAETRAIVADMMKAIRKSLQVQTPAAREKIDDALSRQATLVAESTAVMPSLSLRDFQAGLTEVQRRTAYDRAVAERVASMQAELDRLRQDEVQARAAYVRRCAADNRQRDTLRTRLFPSLQSAEVPPAPTVSTPEASVAPALRNVPASAASDIVADDDDFTHISCPINE